MRRRARSSTRRSRTGRALTTDAGAQFDREVTLDANDIAPIVTWGTSPEDALPIDASVPDPGARAGRRPRQLSARRARLHGHRAGQEAHRHRDRSRVHRLLHQLAHRGSARGGRGARRPQQQGAGLGLAGLDPGQAPGRSRRGSTASSATPGSNGANPAARCASASTAIWSRRASAAPRPPTAISAAARAPARARI